MIFFRVKVIKGDSDLKRVLDMVLILVLVVAFHGFLFADVTIISAVNGSGSYGFYVPVPKTDMSVGCGGKFSVNSDQTTTNGWFALVAYGLEFDANIIDNRLVSFSMMKGYSCKINDNTRITLSLGLLEIETDSKKTITFLPFCTPYLVMDIKI